MALSHDAIGRWVGRPLLFEEGMSPAHDWFHVLRVETDAEALVAESPDADARVVRLAALLHDIGRAREDRGEIADHAA